MTPAAGRDDRSQRTIAGPHERCDRCVQDLYPKIAHFRRGCRRQTRLGVPSVGRRARRMPTRGLDRANRFVTGLPNDRDGTPAFAQPHIVRIRQRSYITQPRRARSTLARGGGRERGSPSRSVLLGAVPHAPAERTTLHHSAGYRGRITSRSASISRWALDPPGLPARLPSPLTQRLQRSRSHTPRTQGSSLRKQHSRWAERRNAYGVKRNPRAAHALSLATARRCNS
jgi:hypothetical protein